MKTAAIMIGVVFGLIGIWTKSSETSLARFENTSDMLAAFGSESIQTGLKSLIAASASGGTLGKSEYQALLVDLAPLHEHLVTWSMCMSANLCDTKKTLSFYCNRVVQYEEVMQMIMAKSGRKDNREDRFEQYFGIAHKCPDWS